MMSVQNIWSLPRRLRVLFSGLSFLLVLPCCVLAEQRGTSSRQDRLLLGKQVAKDLFHSLPELETLVRIEDHGLHECLGLLTTRFPNGFDGQAPLYR